MSVSYSDASGLNSARIWNDGQSFIDFPISTSLEFAGVTSDPVPELANFEYRIFCHPLKDVRTFHQHR